ncbi:FAD-binding domain-containing protein [Trematosphaeria pertusa]|uniref:FAD-binding domain-containing protein n=1 Tax=Trematosphaeria pertusa TaxID=390896 RepID=A0A6A6IGI9_9PLEO|nr:FAD-binding domain-containing protein [Trematosphaeria pertusa]KAF2249526.1 FAD-binding domain-containing protein [Trematosphaeria pertusa]
MSDIKAALPPTCTVVVPTADTPIHEAIPRWSDALISLPYAIVTPSTTADITAAIAYAAANNLRIIPAAGGHASFVPVTTQTIYLDMRSFQDVELDEVKQQVTIGGGCLAGRVMKSLAEKGWYTAVPNSDAVGMVGALLGGMNHPLIGLHGMGSDCVRGITVVPFSRAGGEVEPVTVGPESEGEERALFDALRGAGHGLGVVTSVTLQVWRIGALRLSDGKVWTRRLMFPALQLSTATRAYISLVPPAPQLAPVLAFLRAPPSALNPGAPLVMLAVSYFGPAEEAERVCARTFEDGVVAAAGSAVTGMVEWGRLNEGNAVLNRHGGFKEYHSAFVREFDEEGIARAFEAWEAFTRKDVPGRGASYVVLGSWSAEKMMERGGRGFFNARDRGTFVQATPWYVEAREEEADDFGRGVLEAIRGRDRSVGRRDWGFGNNLLAGMDMREVYSEEQMKEVSGVKRAWDNAGVGWSPAVEGW